MNTKKSVWQNAVFLAIAMEILSIFSACADIRVSFESSDSGVDSQKLEWQLILAE